MKYPIAIIGAGAVGGALAVALHEAGYHLTAIIDRGSARAKKVASLASAARAGSDFGLIGHDTRLVLLAVPDEKIADLDRALAKAHGAHKFEICAHTSGALRGDVLGKLRQLGVAAGSIHPLQTFAQKDFRPTLRGIYFAIEGDEQAAAALEQIAHGLGGNPVRIPSEAKVAYHAAAVFASNFLPVLLQAALELAQDAQFEPDQAQLMFAPLMRQSLENALKEGPVKALTGPLTRGDAETVKSHLSLLGAEHLGLTALYRILSLRALELAIQQGLSGSDLEKLQRALTS